MEEEKKKLFEFSRPRKPIDAVEHVEVTPGGRSRLIDVDAAHMESQKLLPAGAAGPAGNPYKMLRTQVLGRMAKLETNMLAVLSPTEGDGKTLTAINLAIAIAAETGRTSLLVDLDLRNPSVHRRFGFEPIVGLEDCLELKNSIQDAMVRVRGYDRMALLPAGRRVQNSSELLSDQRCATFVQELRRRYVNRIIIFDLPPVLQADDALAFSRHVTAGLMVVGEGRTKRDDVVRAIDLLRDITIVGTVLNGSRERTRTYY